MKELLGSAVLAGSISLLSGCLSAPFQPPMGAFTAINAPLSVEYDKTPITMKRGSASCINVLGLFAIGDASTHTAAQNGRLTMIHHLDYEYFNLLGIYQKTTVNAYGE